MITNFIAAKPEHIKVFENGNADKKDFIDMLKNFPVFSCGTFEIINYILTGGNTDSPMTVFTGEGEILAGPGGETLMFEWMDFETEDNAKYAMRGPAVYKNTEDLQKAVKLSLSVERERFEKNFNFEKMKKEGVFIAGDEQYVKDNKEEIVSVSYEDFVKIRKLYYDALNEGKYVILFYLYDEF